ncbi:ATP-dependent DNA helicase PIF1 [Linum grandiflorum]
MLTTQLCYAIPQVCILWSSKKRGLPHAHILVWLAKDAKLNTPDQIDKVISAELPNPVLDHVGYAGVTKFMVHGPCGDANPKSPCMVDGKCKKYVPKAFNTETTFDEYGYAIYKRRNTGITVVKSTQALDNGYIVPYNRDLIVKYQAHINVELCHKGQLIRYLFKYITKGPDRSNVVADRTDSTCGPTSDQEQPPIDEIAQYLDCRSISSYEAVWRLFQYPIHERKPNVVCLCIHLPGQQPVSFTASQPIASIVGRLGLENTMLTQWFSLNRRCPDARKYTYEHIPNAFVYVVDNKDWTARKKGFAVGRIPSVPVASGDLFYLRLLLGKVPEDLSFNHLRTYNTVLYLSYQQTCQAMGLLASDDEWDSVMAEVSRWAHPAQIRSVFVSLLIYCELSDPIGLLQRWWESMADDFAYRQRILLNNPLSLPPSEDLFDTVLTALETLLHTYSTRLAHYHLPVPNRNTLRTSGSEFLQRHFSYNTASQAAESQSYHSSLNEQQLHAYTEIMDSVTNSKGKFFFLHGHGDTGKTFLYNCIISKVRSSGKIALVVASSGIAATLLLDGVTAHSCFKIPLKVDHLSTCNIKKGTELAELFKIAALIVWDEAPMIHRLSFEALDRTLCDIMDVPLMGPNYRPFGGKTVILGGDFRQTLPVVPNRGREDNINASLPRSYLWNYCKLLHLTINMRISDIPINNDLIFFGMKLSDWVLSIGNGALNTKYHSSGQTDWVEIPDYFLHTSLENDPIQDIIAKIPGSNVEDLELEYPIEFLNSLSFNRIPEHELKLKEFATVMLLRNLNPAAGLCNGTRILLTNLGDHVLRGIIVGGTMEGTVVVIPRIVLDVKAARWPFTLKRRQYPIRLCYAMTISKSQGQTLDKVGLFLPKPVFAHGQLYVAVSRIRSAEGLHIVLQTDSSKSESTTRNIVYQEILEDLESP